MQAIVARLQRELGGAFHVVHRPDHPMLLSGPDVLIGGEGKLTAILSIGAREPTSGLLARITAARLALPSTTRILAAVSEDATLSEGLLRNFDEVVSAGLLPTIALRYATSDARPSGDVSSLRESKRRHSEKFSFALLVATLRHKHELGKVSPASVIRELAQMRAGATSSELGARRVATQVRGSYVASLSTSGRPIQQLRKLCDFGLNFSYQLDTGVPYENPDASLNVLLVEDWPTARHDPEKPVRSAAFGCWVMAQSSGADDIAHLIERVQDPKFIRKWRYAQG